MRWTPEIVYVGDAALAGIISMYSVKKIIFTTRNRKIYDTPDDTRKIHGAEIPTLGGIGIFIGYMLLACIFWPRQQPFMPYVLASTIILFFTGIYDDLMNMRPSKKLVAQLAAAFITVWLGDIRIDNLYGIAGIGAIPYWAGVGLTTIACTFFINVFNFVDGIDGLACVTAILYSSVLGLLFTAMGFHLVAGIAFALAGASAGLLVYNLAPAKIYMGDTGSMLLGFTIFALAVLLLKMYGTHPAPGILHSPQAAITVIYALLLLPMYDALRVFALRASRGISPLRADRTHLHYYLLDAGCSHTQAVVLLLLCNIALVAIAWLMQDVTPLLNMLVVTVVATLMMGGVYVVRSGRR